MEIIELIQMSCMYLMFLPANKRNPLEYNMMFFRVFWIIWSVIQDHLGDVTSKETINP